MASGLSVDVSQIRKRLGETQPVTVDVAIEPVVVLDSSTNGDPVQGSLTLTSIERGVTVVGGVTSGWVGQCRRCLDPVSGVLDAPVNEIFQMGAGDDSELWDFDGTTVDLIPVIRESLLGVLPPIPLCRDDCPGPDPERFPTQIEPDEPDTDLTVDPRWGALGEVRFD